MSNINPQALFRKFPFLGQYYDVNDIHFVEVCLLGPDILERRRRDKDISPGGEWLNVGMEKTSFQEMLFLDAQGRSLHSIGRKKPGFFWGVCGDETVGGEFFKLSLEDNPIAYVVLWVRLYKPLARLDQRYDRIHHLTFCKPTSGKTLTQHVDSLVEQAEAAITEQLLEKPPH